jgi:spore germination cell wall hydrolase CwlJ-like protein
VGLAGPASETPSGRVIPDDVWGILCVFAESRGEPHEGQVAVASVIRNRTERRFFSDGTVASTVLRPYQFSWANTQDGQRTRVFSAKWEDAAWKAAARAWFESALSRPVGDATHYHSDAVSPEWSRSPHMSFVRQIGHHRFYREVLA